VRVVEPEVLALAGEIPANFVVSRSLALALSSYVLRRASIPWSRRLQIARHVGEPLREQFGLPPDTNHDRLLCAVYQRAFFGDTEAPLPTSPFAPAGGAPVAVSVAVVPAIPAAPIAEPMGSADAENPMADSP
jgi:hypothetical protein